MLLASFRRALPTAVTFAFAIAISSVAVVPDQASAATTGPTITAPAAGEVVPFRFEGPFTVDLTGAAPGSYTGQVYCRPAKTSDGVSQVLPMPEFSWDGSTDPVRAFTAPEPLVTRSGLCTWSIFKAPIGATVETVASSAFTIAPPPDPTILAPAPGEVLAPGSSGPFTVDLTGAEPGTYWSWIRCADGGWSDVNLGDVTWDGETDPVRTFTADEEIPTLQDCTWTIYKGYSPEWIGDRVTFRVEKRALEMSNVSQSPATFYPRVRDGYLDTTTTRYYLTRGATGSVTVRDSAGQVVRRQRGLRNVEGWHSWKWNGRDNAGNRLPAGKYRITVRNTDSSGNTRSFTTVATVATKVLVKTGKAHFYGADGRRATAGDCTARYDGAATELDCWGGRYARVRFGFTIPAKAYDTRVKVSGYLPDIDFCCDGRITRKTIRPKARSLVTTVKVTGWRAYTVLGVTATWKYNQRI